MRPEDGTRDRLVWAARAHLDEHGLDGLSLRAIARRAGVSHGAPMRHFPGVAHLLAAAAAQGFRELYESVDTAVGEVAGDAVDRLAGASRGYARFALASPGVFELMFRHERRAADDPDLQQAGSDAFLQLVGLVADAQAEGWHPEVAAGELAAVVWAVVHGAVALWLPGTLAGAVGLTGITADLDRILDLSSRIVLAHDPVRTAPRRVTA